MAKFKYTLFSIFFGFTFFSEYSFSATYYIERNRDTIFDHGNANQAGTLAWHFKEYGAGNTFVLSTPAAGGSYGVVTQLVMPVGSVLESSAGGRAWVRAYAELPSLISVADSSRVSNVVLDGNYKVGHVIHGSAVNDFTLEYSVVRRSKNNNGTARVRAHLVALSGSNNVTIANNTIANAGDNGSNVGNINTSAAGLYLTGSQDIEVRENNISYVLSSGVDITGSKRVLIENNTIDNVGRSNKYNGNFPADGITAYHNYARPEPGSSTPIQQDLRYTVRGNTITNWYNHGIHLSGRWLDIRNNTVISPGKKFSTGHAIFVGDYLKVGDPAPALIECSSIIWIQNNHVERNVEPNNSNPQSDGIRAWHYKHTAYWPSQNTGDVGDSNNVTDHRFGNLGSQGSCPYGFSAGRY